MTNLLQQTWQTLLAHRMKSALAIIAIAWGVISVVVLIALGEGFYRHQTQQLSFLMNNVQVAFPSSTSKAWQGLPSRRQITISQEQVERIKNTGLVDAVSSVYAKWDASVTNEKGQNLSSSVNGIDSNYFSLMQSKFEPTSRHMSPSDIANHTRVAVLGDQIAKMGGLSIGHIVKVNGIPFLVIGVLKDEDSTSFFSDSRTVYIPQTTYRDLWNVKPWMLLMKPIEGMDAHSFRKSVVRFLFEAASF